MWACKVINKEEDRGRKKVGRSALYQSIIITASVTLVKSVSARPRRVKVAAVCNINSPAYAVLESLH